MIGHKSRFNSPPRRTILAVLQTMALCLSCGTEPSLAGALTTCMGLNTEMRVVVAYKKRWALSFLL